MFLFYLLLPLLALEVAGVPDQFPPEQAVLLEHPLDLVPMNVDSSRRECLGQMLYVGGAGRVRRRR